METGLSIVQVVVVLAAMLGFAGCEGEESVLLSDEIRSVANIEKKWERGCLRWRKAKCRYRADVDTTAMIRAAHDFAGLAAESEYIIPLKLVFATDDTYIFSMCDKAHPPNRRQECKREDRHVEQNG